MTLMTTNPDGSGWVSVGASTSNGQKQQSPLHEATQAVKDSAPMTMKASTMPEANGSGSYSDEQQKIIQDLQRQLLAKQLECFEARSEASQLRDKLLAAELKQQEVESQRYVVASTVSDVQMEADNFRFQVVLARSSERLQDQLAKERQDNEGLKMQLDAAQDVIWEQEEKLRQLGFGTYSDSRFEGLQGEQESADLW